MATSTTWISLFWRATDHLGTSSSPHDRIVICTGNPGKVAELKALLPASFKLVMLTDVGLPTDLPETGTTLKNALQKARFAFERTGMTCIADDTGWR